MLCFLCYVLLFWIHISSCWNKSFNSSFSVSLSINTLNVLCFIILFCPQCCIIVYLGIKFYGKLFFAHHLKGISLCSSINFCCWSEICSKSDNHFFFLSQATICLCWLLRLIVFSFIQMCVGMGFICIYATEYS